MIDLKVISVFLLICLLFSIIATCIWDFNYYDESSSTLMVESYVFVFSPVRFIGRFTDGVHVYIGTGYNYFMDSILDVASIDWSQNFFQGILSIGQTLFSLFSLVVSPIRLLVMTIVDLTRAIFELNYDVPDPVHGHDYGYPWITDYFYSFELPSVFRFN